MKRAHAAATFKLSLELGAPRAGLQLRPNSEFTSWVAKDKILNLAFSYSQDVFTCPFFISANPGWKWESSSVLYWLYSLSPLFCRVATGQLSWLGPPLVFVLSHAKVGTKALECPYRWHCDYIYLKEHPSINPFTKSVLFIANSYNLLSLTTIRCVLSVPPNLDPLITGCLLVLLPTEVWKDEIIPAENVS